MKNSSDIKCNVKHHFSKLKFLYLHCNMFAKLKEYLELLVIEQGSFLKH